MPILDGRDQERKGMMDTANLMVVSSRTAPKSGGVDDILTAIIFGEEVGAVVAEMEKLARERRIDGWSKQAQEIKGAEIIVLIGVRGTKRYATNCGACGYKSCEDFEKADKRLVQDFEGPTCIFKALDLGIAICSAVKIASLLNVDNRIFYRVGVAAKRLKYLPEASIIMGIPLSCQGKNPYFNR